ncbi:uncharacterized protein CTRU02_206941 [Colletotrichum truncatum]|uniref:Uncharacterized protein n=1 Tax=Colletotrichum truncatum TaxID=5467 RepID=A0ACC3YZ16_COLTU|nr:uncharacterized protein CTRU02_11205 [Colletotrichum truncatum]KAF6786334.1 hypothetical protein CTRU02_11205 [Colletotrichum truncatum]
MTSLIGLDCSSLESLHGFDNYLRQLRAVTHFNETLLNQCRKTICNAVWGEGNPDISGIGVSIGYATEAGLGFLFALIILVIQQKQGPKWEFFQVVTETGLNAFFGSAVYFAISHEIASIYILVNKDYGISTTGLSASEAQIILAVSVVCILPLLYPVALLPTCIFHPESKLGKPLEARCAKSAKPRNVRFILFSLLAVLFFYPFLSQCIHNWAPTRVGEGNGPDGETLATETEWAKVETMCFVSIERLSDTELWVLAVCEIIASLSIFVFTIWLAIGAGARTLLAQDRAYGEERRLTTVLLKIQRLEKIWKSNALIRVLLLLVPTVLAGPLLWCIFRLRSMQSIALEKLGSDYTGDEWGFGQIIGIVIFAPVVTDMTFAAWAARSLFTPDNQSDT